MLRREFLSTPARWLLWAVVLVVPYVIAFAAGLWYLRELGWLWSWLALHGVLTGLVYWSWTRWRAEPTEARESPVQVSADPRWSPAGEAAWQEVTEIADRVAAEDLALDDWPALGGVVREVLATVARHFHPESKQAVLEVPVPHVLRILELVARDLREVFAAHVPGAHILTLHDFQRVQHFSAWGQRFYWVYRIARWGLDPWSAAAKELREAVGGRLARGSAAEIKRWSVQFAVQKMGHYAIQLYSGQLILDETEAGEVLTRRAEHDLTTAARRQEQLDREPLRVLVVGQVKSGKSSLINALFGETRAAVDVIPRTRGVEPYTLEREGLRTAIILDTAGYAEDATADSPLAAVRAEILLTDFVLLVCSAESAARGPDRQLLDELRTCFAANPTRSMPPILVVMTHIDRLRPWNDWSPPYDLESAANPKARQIAMACEAVATDLRLPRDQVIPVCLAEGRTYNVDDGLVPAILHSLSAAQRVRYQRCLQQVYEDSYWPRLWEQAVHSGRWLRSVVAEVTARTQRRS